MNIYINETKEELGQSAAGDAIQIISKAISEKGTASIIVATGASQSEMLEVLVSNRNIDWSKVVVFHLDEYVKLSATHPASFRRYLKEHVVDLVPSLKAVHLINGEAKDLNSECDRLSKIIAEVSVDVAFVGIGENGHLAFNDPPADFESDQPFMIVELDEACRRQQVGEGCFAALEDVPRTAITMSVRQIMKSEYIICSVPDQRKAVAVRNCLENDISNKYPSSILRKHKNCSVYLDRDSASLLTSKDIRTIKYH